MQYNKLCDHLDKLDKTAKRLEITAILADLINQLTAEETEQALFLSLGYLNPPYNQIKFNMADKMVARSLELCYGVNKEEVDNLYSDTGDLGDTAMNLALRTKGATENKTTILQTHQKLLNIAEDEGPGSQDRKITKLSGLLKTLSPLAVKYTVRIVLGTTRLGFTEQTIIDALSKIVAGDKSASRKIEEVYNIHPNIGLIARMIKEKGLAGLNAIGLETGVPVLSQKAQRLSDPQEILEKMEGQGWLEYKLDGTRVQLHLDRKKQLLDKTLEQNPLFGFNKNKILVKTFTRNLEENTYQFPDITQSALKQIKAESVILDGEAVGFDPATGKYIPFQEMMQRKRKHNVGEYAKQIPLKYVVFDILYLNGKNLTNLPLAQRHEHLEKVLTAGGVVEIAYHQKVADATELWEFFESSKEKNLEGIMIKNPNAPYRAGAREFSWIKLKRSNTDILEDTVDCVVLGYYFGRGNRATFGIGGFLCGIWNEKEQVFTTLTKVGTGLRDEEWVELKNRCDKLQVQQVEDAGGAKTKEGESVSGPLPNVLIPKALSPDVWVKPKIVVELGGDEISVSQVHTSGYALRFPRLIRFRDDKSPTDTTTLKEIVALHKSQRKPL